MGELVRDGDRPDPTWVYHITRMEHLPSMIVHGLWSDTLASARRLSSIGIAHTHLKAKRTQRSVPIQPGGVLADYVPWYFAPRSPMLYAIHKGNVAGHGPDCSRIVYLSTTVGELRQRGLAVLGTDRHALMDYTRFTDDDAELTTYVDWPLMRARIWRSEADDPDRSERRQAELLVHRHVPWDSIAFIAAKTAATVAEVQAMVASAGVSTRLLVRPDWYF